jgi:hypothetical protein
VDRSGDGDRVELARRLAAGGQVRAKPCSMSHGAVGSGLPVSRSDFEFEGVPLGVVGEGGVGDGESSDLGVGVRCRT